MTKLHRTRWDERASAAVNARRELPPLAASYFARVRALLARDPSPLKLHRLRLATKRLRYTLELFRPCYGPGLDTRLAALRRIQQLLGEVNDSTAAARLLSQSMSTASPQRARILRFLEERAAVKAQEFRKDWAEVFDAPGQERWWTTYLARHARTPPRRP
ncbi:MAG: CHAD domain-containing protein [Bryobacteraceae bacterium]|jgi:CHAD domain-containing protein